MFWYKTAKVGEWLVINGCGMEDVRVCKKAFTKPWQKVSRISLVPYKIRYKGQPKTVEKHDFDLEIVFTVAPDDDPEALKRHALSFPRNDPRFSVNKTESDGSRSHILSNIIGAEVNATVSQFTIEEIFKEREIFKDAAMRNVQKQFHIFGMRVLGACIIRISDFGDSYFADASRIFREAVSTQAEIDSAETEMKGEIGKARILALKRQETCKIMAERTTLETGYKKKAADAETEFARHKLELDNGLQVAKVTAKHHYDMTETELQRQVEMKNAEKELERLRASEVVKSKASRESAQEKADARLYEEQKEADAALYKAKLEADALYYYQKQEASGMLEMAKAYSALVNALGGPQGFLQYRMIESGTYEKLAKANGLAINGLQPKITMWNTGNGDNSSNNPIRNILQSLPPLLSTIHDQTGIAPPSWLARMPDNKRSEEDESQEIISKTPLLN